MVDHAVLLPRVDGRRALTQGVIYDISDRKRAEQELAHRADHDALTGLPNRDQFRSRLDDAIAHAQDSRRRSPSSTSTSTTSSSSTTASGTRPATSS